MSFLSRARALSLFDSRPDRAVKSLRRFVESVPGTEVPGTCLES